MKKKLALSVLTLSLSMFAFSNAPVEEGKILFSSQCASCHNVNKVVVGPALAGVSDRHTKDWIVNFIRSSQSVIKGGDPVAVALYEKFNKVPMPDHADMSEDDIKGILAYIKAETKSTTAAPAFRPGQLHPNYKPLLSTNYLFFASYLSLIVVLTVTLVALVRVKEVKRKQETDY